MSDKTDDYVTVKLPVLDPTGYGGLHQNVCSAEVLGARVEVSTGFGLGHTQAYVSVNGRRVLSVDLEPLLRGLIDTALEKTRSGKPPRRRRKEGE